MSRERARHLALAGTVTFPATYPRVAELHLRRMTDLPVFNVAGEPEQTEFLVAVEQQSARTTMIRSLRLCDVRAVFLPRDVNQVDHEDGVWLLGAEVGPGLGIRLNNLDHTGGRFPSGIVYVAETTATLLEVRCGLTAGESVQYYPPLPMDRSVNHYDPSRNQAAKIQPHQEAYCEPAPFPEELQPSPCEDPPIGVPPVQSLGRRRSLCEGRPAEPGPGQSQRGSDFCPTPFPSESDETA